MRSKRWGVVLLVIGLIHLVGVLTDSSFDSNSDRFGRGGVAILLFVLPGIALYWRGRRQLADKRKGVEAALPAALDDDRAVDPEALAGEDNCSMEEVSSFLGHLKLKTTFHKRDVEPYTLSRKHKSYLIKVRDHDPVMPEVCCVTGRRSEFKVPFDKFGWRPKTGAVFPGGFVFVYTKLRTYVWMPFSLAGYAAYQQHRSVFWRVFLGGMKICQSIPILPIELLWIIYFPLLFGWLLLLDAIRGRRELCFIRWTGMWNVKVESRAFAEEFLRLNPSAHVPALGTSECEYERPLPRSEEDRQALLRETQRKATLLSVIGWIMIVVHGFMAGIGSAEMYYQMSRQDTFALYNSIMVIMLVLTFLALGIYCVIDARKQRRGYSLLLQKIAAEGQSQ